MRLPSPSVLCAVALSTLAGCAAPPLVELPDGGVTPDAGVTPPDAGLPDRCERPWRGDQQFGGPHDDAALDVVIDADDNLYLAGYRGATGKGRSGPSGSLAFVRRLSPEGDSVWGHDLGTSTSDLAQALLLDEARGELHVAGRTEGAFPSFTNGGQFDLFLATMTLDGEERTVHQQGSPRPENPQALALAANGDLVVAGYDDTFIPTNYVEAWEDPFVGRLARTQDGRWSVGELRHFGTAGSDFVTGVALDAEGSAYLAGQTSSGPKRGAFVEKRDSQGTVVWHRILSSVGVDIVHDVLVTPQGEVLAVGATFQAIAPMVFGGQDVFVASLDPATGGTRWAAQYGGPESDYPLAVALDRAGNIYVAGETEGSIGKGFTYQGVYDAFALRFSPTGTLTGVWQAGSAGDDSAQGIAVDSCGNAYVVGYASGPIVEGAPHLGGTDAFLRRVEFKVPTE